MNFATYGPKCLTKYKPIREIAEMLVLFGDQILKLSFTELKRPPSLLSL